MKKIKILELTNYTSGGCGVGARVIQEARLLAKNHEVQVFSSYYEKGTNKICPIEEKINKLIIKRFPAKYLGGQSFMSWNFQKEAIKFKPDIIIAHAYRHFHTTRALKIAKKIGAKIFLVTHAPFVEGDTTRSLKEKLIVNLYDKFFARFYINKFNKIIAITPWEIPLLEKIGAKKDKIVLIPNGIREEFFIPSKKKEQNKILFMGRISPIKDLETLILAMKYVKNKNLRLEIIGPAELGYLKILQNLIKSNNLQNKVKITNKTYDYKEQISNLDEAKIYVLPSKSEAMPQTLIEAMARGKIVIASNNGGSSALIVNGKTGHLFQIGDPEALAEKINQALSSNQLNIKKATKKYVEQYRWSTIIKKLEALF